MFAPFAAGAGTGASTPFESSREPDPKKPTVYPDLDFVVSGIQKAGSKAYLAPTDPRSRWPELHQSQTSLPIG